MNRVALNYVAIKLSRGLLAIAALLCASLCSLASVADGRWEKDIAAFEATDKTNPPPKNAVLFVGSSSIRMWKTLAADFPKHKVINRGFGGSQIEDSTEYADRIVLPYQPAAIVLYAGDNDIAAGKTPEQVLSDFKRFVAKVRGGLPKAKISFIAIKPSIARWQLVEKIRAANALIEAHCKADPQLAFLDVFTPMLGSDGKPRPELFVKDGLHLSDEGYALWTKTIRPALDSAAR